MGADDPRKTDEGRTRWAKEPENEADKITSEMWALRKPHSCAAPRGPSAQHGDDIDRALKDKAGEPRLPPGTDGRKGVKISKE
jgi:hypothetical protein